MISQRYKLGIALQKSKTGRVTFFHSPLRQTKCHSSCLPPSDGLKGNYEKYNDLRGLTVVRGDNLSVGSSGVSLLQPAGGQSRGARAWWDEKWTLGGTALQQNRHDLKQHRWEDDQFEMDTTDGWHSYNCHYIWYPYKIVLHFFVQFSQESTLWSDNALFNNNISKSQTVENTEMSPWLTHHPAQWPPSSLPLRLGRQNGSPSPQSGASAQGSPKRTESSHQFILSTLRM